MLPNSTSNQHEVGTLSWRQLRLNFVLAGLRRCGDVASDDKVDRNGLR